MWVLVRSSARQSLPIISLQVSLRRPWRWPPAGLSFWMFCSQPSLRPTSPYHLIQYVQNTLAKSSSCTLSNGSCELTCSLVVTPHIQRIIARSLRRRWCIPDKGWAQVSLTWSMALLSHDSLRNTQMDIWRCESFIFVSTISICNIFSEPPPPPPPHTHTHKTQWYLIVHATIRYSLRSAASLKYKSINQSMSYWHHYFGSTK